MRLDDLTADQNSLFIRLKDLYAEMSDTSDRAVVQYGLDCTDCPDNCCLTRFYNHTYIEYFYLMEGMTTLPEEKQKEFVQKAIGVCENIAELEARGEPPRAMCPLNEEGRCGLYDFRPMICRLHGIPYDLFIPGRDAVRGEGCTIFIDQFQDKPYIEFDRTPLYQKLSYLEGDVRAATGRSRKIKMTIAEMIAYDPGDPLHSRTF